MHRLMIELSDRQSDVLQRAAGDLDDTQAGTVRLALSLLALALDGRKEGSRLGFVRDGRVIREIGGVWDAMPAGA